MKQRWRFLPEQLALRLARAYGTRIKTILGTAGSMRDLGEHFGAGLTTAEVRYLVANEWALTAEDILWRRTKIGLHMTNAERASVDRYLEVQRAQHNLRRSRALGACLTNIRRSEAVAYEQICDRFARIAGTM